MADILIRGMEMPKKGNPLTVLIYPDGTATWKDREYKAIPVPPHGRLIDADALMNNIGDVPYKGTVRRVLMSAPTIIEADLEWKMKNCCCFSNTDQAEGGGKK